MGKEMFCGAPLRLTTEQVAARDALNARLRLETVPCLCGGNRFETLATHDRYGIAQPTVICLKCALIQSNPRMTAADTRAFYASDEYRALYDGGNFDYSARYTPSAGRTIHRALETFSPRRVLEIGAGGGWNLIAFREAGIAVTGYDYSSKMVELGKSKGIDMRLGSIDDAVASGERWDAVILNHVLEHFLSPVTELRKLHAITDRLFVGVPATDYPWRQLLQSAHVYYFTRATLRHYIAAAGWKCANVVRENSCRMHAVATPGADVAAIEKPDAALSRLKRNRVLVPAIPWIDRAYALRDRLI